MNAFAHLPSAALPITPQHRHVVDSTQRAESEQSADETHDAASLPLLRIFCHWTDEVQVTALFSKLFEPKFLSSDHLRGWSIVVNSPHRCDRPEAYPLARPANTIVLRMEPSCDTVGGEYWNEWIQEGTKELKPDDFAFWGGHNHHLNTVEWHLPFSVTEISSMNFQHYKSVVHHHSISVVCSGQYELPGHRYRVQLLRYWYANRQPRDHVTLYGRDGDLGMPLWYRGALPAFDKREALLPFRFTFACENVAKCNYATEKLWDALLTETVCFYHGCPNIEKWIHPDCFVRLPAGETFDQTIDRIRAVLHVPGADYRYRNSFLPAIRQTRDAIISRWSLQSRVRSLIVWHTSDVEIIVINIDHSEERWRTFAQRAHMVGLSSGKIRRVSATGSPVVSDLSRNHSSAVAPRYAANHFFLWESVASWERPCLIFEDDAKFVEPDHGWLDMLYDAFSRLPERWSYACLSWQKLPQLAYPGHRNESRWWALTDLFTAYCARRDCAQTCLAGTSAGYLLHPAGAKELLRKGSGCSLDEHISAAAQGDRSSAAYVLSFPIVCIP